jgi:hypothetical protein
VGRFSDLMYLGLVVANVLLAKAWIFHTSQRLGRIGLGMFTGKDGWIHWMPSIGGRWTQNRDLRGLPDQSFHEWWAARAKETK